MALRVGNFYFNLTATCSSEIRGVLRWPLYLVALNQSDYCTKPQSPGHTFSSKHDEIPHFTAARAPPPPDNHAEHPCKSLPCRPPPLEAGDDDAPV